jgi:hypothetical protein
MTAISNESISKNVGRVSNFLSLGFFQTLVAHFRNDRFQKSKLYQLN